MRSPSKADDAAVAQAYLRRITGYDVTETQEEYKRGEDGALELTKRTEKTKHVPGDPRAAEFWLINRRPQLWRPARLLAPPEDGGGETAAGVVELPAVEAPPEEGEGEA